MQNAGLTIGMVAICIGLASIGGMAYRKPERIHFLTGLAIALILTAIITVYFRHAASGSYE